MSPWWLLPAYWLGRHQRDHEARPEVSGGLSSVAGWVAAGLIASVLPIIVLACWDYLIFGAAFGVAGLLVIWGIVLAGITEARPER